MMTGKEQQPKTILEAALYYVEKLGFGLCSIPPGTKGPRAAGWNTSPSLFINTKEKVLAQYTRHPDHGAGSIHSASRTATIDVDHAEWAAIMFEAFGIDLAEILQAGLQISSGRPNRAKALFRIPASLAEVGRKSVSWPDPQTGKPICVLELRGGKTQDVLPPSIHPDTGQPYEWINAPWDNGDEVPELPEIVVNIWLNWDTFAQQLKSACPWDKTELHTPEPPKVQRQADNTSLRVIDVFNDAHDLPAMLEQYGYKKRGKRFLAPSSTTKLPGVKIFPDGRHFFSHHGSDVFGDGRRHDCFDIFCEFECGGNFSQAVAKAADLLGLDNSPKQAPEMDVSAFIEKTKHAAAPPPPKPKPAPKPPQTGTGLPLGGLAPIPENLLNPPGILGDIAAHCLGSALMPQPVFAVNAALLLVATIGAQRVMGPTGGRTNLYLTSLGPSGCGKEYPRTYIKNMLYALGFSDLVAGEEIASGQALLTRAAMEPRSLIQIDEFGLFLQTVTDKNASGHKFEIMRQLMSLYSKTGTIVRGTEYANQKQNERVEIRYPCLGLHGSSTEETFIDALGSRHIYDGALNRFIVTSTDDIRPQKNLLNRLDDSTPTEAIREWHEAFENWLSGAGTSNLAGVNPAAAIKVGATDEAAQFLKHYDAKTDAKYKEAYANGSAFVPLYARSAEHVYKIALICGCGGSSPLIDIEAAEWAAAFVDYWTAELIHKASNIADTDFGREMGLILEQIGKHPEGLTAGRIFNQGRKLRELPADRRESLLRTLLMNEQIAAREVGGEKAGRYSVKYFLA